MMRVNKNNIYNLIITIKPYGNEMLLAIISSLLKQVFILGSVTLTSYIVGLAIEGKLNGNIKPLLIALGVCIFLRAFMYYGEMWFAHDVAFRVLRNFRLDLYQKISDISPAYTLRKKTGQLGQTLTGDVEVLELFLAHTFSGFIVAVIMTSITLGIYLTISPILAVLLLVAAVLLAMVPYYMKKRAEEQGLDVREKLAETNAIMMEGVQGLREIITLNSIEKYKKKLLTNMKGLHEAQETYSRRKGVEGMFTQIFCGCFIVAVMIISAMLVADGKIEFVLYPVTVMLSAVVLAPVIEVAAVAQELGLVFAASNRINNVLTAIPVVRDEGTLICSKDNCKIHFQNVNFTYPEQEDKVLQNVNFTIEPLENAVLIGHSGAGKTTCASLLLRFWDTLSGSIEIEGRDIRSYTIKSLRETISAVQQETYLFHTSVRNNIRMGRIDASDEEVEYAAKAANAHEFICTLPEGYDTITGERGFQLSGGQRQRIAIARVLLKDTPIVIFDEAVSNLDSENERYIEEMLKTKLKGKTVLTIAHRLSTILKADKIIILNQGCVVATGTHKQLMMECSTYKELIREQLKVNETF